MLEQIYNNMNVFSQMLSIYEFRHISIYKYRKTSYEVRKHFYLFLHAFASAKPP